MSDRMTQQEIDEMIRLSLQQTNESDPSGAHPAPASTLTTMETDALGEIGNISMGSAATALHAILGRKVLITTPHVSVITLRQLTASQMTPYVVVDVEYTEGFIGHNLFILRIDDVKAITDIMMGGDGIVSAGPLDELHLSAISEAMNQMMGGVATAMAEMFSQVVNISPPRTTVVLLSEQDLQDLIDGSREELIRISFKMEIEGLTESGIMQLMPLAFGLQLVQSAMESSTRATAATHSGNPMHDQARRPTERKATEKSIFDPTPASAADQRQPINVRPIRLASFDTQPETPSTQPDYGIGLILDVPLQITVELGQCKRTIKDVLELTVGSIVTLDRMAGEPVDVVVNGKAVARGEVIVIEENYGIRITEVLATQARLRTVNA